MTIKFQPVRRFVLGTAICALSVSLASGSAAWATGSDAAASYPQRPVTIVDGFAPGGSTDVLARVVGQHLSKALGQPVVVENRAGAGGIVATSHVSRAAADGYTLLLGTIGPIVVNPNIMKDLNYKPLQDLEPILSLVDVANVMVVKGDHPAKGVQDIVQLAKTNPDQVDFGSAGIGTTAHLAGEVFQQGAGIKLTHVPYRGGAPAMTGLLGGETDLIFSSVPTAVEHVKNGRLRALAVTGSKPLDTLPGVPPLKDAGIAGYELPSWYGVFAPAGTPQPIVAKIGNELAKILELPEVKSQLIALGMVPNPVHAADFKRQLGEDTKYWKGVLEKANIRFN
ncbi:tripartite tricarboxylate transporter substrate binding protein [Candidimonas sp. SYP-B2681]|uniref:Bug family tripartite tricarboxylate transporter substrate binding protein n=1 Tax=Candidimonas sp. SYP-B2681 TaxID=2497686 RepID=UPI000F88B450|nr:tripartite tricarboxylate transporter substrate binding protein [Candidimonas sp. SYP-B2681]RTZ39140.1 tripartite tricarboxylate transporter substrate binding protein [Candidimonas sp. SYP-B2681]